MGLSSKKVSSDNDVEWSRTLSDSTTKDTPKSPSTRTHQQSEPLDCPRCGSRNTKFCYYNNYDKSQPRHFCRTCKRHWTKGGTLRNVPIGGGRKNKRLKTPNSSKSTTAAAATSTAVPMLRSNADGNLTNHQDCQHHHLASQEGLKALTDHQKNISDNVFEAFADCSHQDRKRNFAYSGLDSFPFTSNPSSSSGNEETHNLYDYCSSQLEGLGSSTIAMLTQNMSNSIFSQPWQGSNTSDGMAEMPNCWNWNDLDTLISADLNIPWDDEEINP